MFVERPAEGVPTKGMVVRYREEGEAASTGMNTWHEKKIRGKRLRIDTGGTMKVQFGEDWSVTVTGFGKKYPATRVVPE